MNKALASVLSAAWGFVAAPAANFALDGAVSLSFILIATANALVTPRELHGRVRILNGFIHPVQLPQCL